nr:MAG TPA: hypothetical protein [Caudoviricetes sp.]
MTEIIANLIIENIYQEVKIATLEKILFENNIISEKEFNDKTSKLLKDKDFLTKKLKKLLSENTPQELFDKILNNFINK